MIKNRILLGTHTAKVINLPRRKHTLRIRTRIPRKTRLRIRIARSRRKLLRRIPHLVPSLRLLP